jgi:DNA (cytosine-5)-methyltransferase 1
MNKLKLLDLFSGIGGFSLGLESTGYFQTIAFVEKDKFCRQVLQKNFNNIPIEEDIRNVRGSNYAADVITGGFPCQPFSVAGKRKGTDDDRYLWDETIRVVAECKPRWFIGENVEGLININNGMVLRQVQTDLEEQGFQVQCIVIPASGIGAWHQRKRIWIVAYSDSNRHSNKIRGSSTKEERISQEHRQDHNTTRKSSRASSVWETNNQHVPNTDTGFGIRENQEIQTGGTPLSMAVKMFPTPTAGCVEGGEQSSRVEMTENGGFILRKKNKPEMTFGAKLSDAMIFLEKQLYNTPTTNDAKNLTFPKSQTNRTSIVGNLIQQEQIKPGGKLNPNFVEFLMGYPMNWTKIDQAE